MKTAQSAPALIVTAVLFACSSAQSDWNKADAANTATAFQDFLKQHPNDDHAPQAHDRIRKIQDDEAWGDAQKSDTLEAYQNYLQKEPSGTHVADAHTQETALERAAEWKLAHSANTEPAIQGFLQKYSQGPEVDQAREQLKKLQSEQYRIQLSSFKDEKHAEKSRDGLQARLGNELHDLVIIPANGSDKLIRVDSGPMTEADAKSACMKLKKEHQRCEVVKG